MALFNDSPIFTAERQQFFLPLAGKYRGAAVQCIRWLYHRLFSDMPDYDHGLNREQVLDMFQEALNALEHSADVTNTVGFGDSEEKGGEEKGSEEDTLPDHLNTKEQAIWILQRLVHSGWLEKHVDEATLRSSYGFTRLGRLFAQALVDSAKLRVKTRHRNTRNTRNSLQAFASMGDVHDLLDACEYSEHIVSDFSDLVAELDERKRQLMQEVEAQELAQRAGDAFFDFMEKRFVPDLSVRLSTDNVEKFRDDILSLIDQIRAQPTEWKVTAERRLRELLPDQIQPGQSLLWEQLDIISARTRNASDVILPALRKALHSFTQRADIIIRQLTYLNANRQQNVAKVCADLKQLSPQAQDKRLAQAAEHLERVDVGWLDPAQVRLQSPRQRRVPQWEDHGDDAAIDVGAQRELKIHQWLDQAFLIADDSVRAYLKGTLLDQGFVNSEQLPINNAEDLLAAAHAIEAANVGNHTAGQAFSVEPNGRRVTTDYFISVDSFRIGWADAKSVLSKSELSKSELSKPELSKPVVEKSSPSKA